MYSLSGEINGLIDEAFDSGEGWSAGALVVRLMARYPFPASWQGEARDWNEQRVRDDLHIEFRKKLRERKASDQRRGAAQPALPGFEYLWAAYPVERDGEPWIVPVDQMTLTELLGKELELAKMEKGLAAHRADLRRYIERKFGAEALAEAPSAALLEAAE
jgi:hypothetical protein